MDELDSQQQLRELYEAAYPRLVGLVAAVARNQHDAEEAVQDAFVRLMGRWDAVRRYDDPEAWVRKAALGYLSNRRRKIRNGLKAVLRLGPPADVPAATGESVDLRRALATLPTAQREVLALAAAGLDTAAIARQLDIPEGTVKSRTSRARAALLPLLREDVTDHA